MNENGARKTGSAALIHPHEPAVALLGLGGPAEAPDVAPGGDVIFAYLHNLYISLMMLYGKLTWVRMVNSRVVQL
jgi:hypothetical protein